MIDAQFQALLLLAGIAMFCLSVIAVMMISATHQLKRLADNFDSAAERKGNAQ
jgi:hypothetical protein